MEIQAALKEIRSFYEANSNPASGPEVRQIFRGRLRCLRGGRQVDCSRSVKPGSRTGARSTTWTGSSTWVTGW